MTNMAKKCSGRKQLPCSAIATQVPVLLLFLLASTVKALSSRQLQENEEQQQYDDGSYNNNNQGDDRFAFVGEAADRLEQDAEGMWYSSPSEWITEYWEVFGVALLVLCCLFACNCALCCCSPSGASQKEMVVATQQEVNEYERRHNQQLQQQQQRGDLEQPILLDESTVDESTVRTVTRVDAGDNATTATSVASNKKRRSRSTVLGEVVSVWSEFLGFADQDDEETYYKNMSASGSTKSKRKKSKRKALTKQMVNDLPRQSDV